ncbi:MAG: hypothetical protein P8I12_03250 [SAR86 cluster bacterium]|nr:hypothetical protein [SAR86 cluster bacterium]
MKKLLALLLLFGIVGCNGGSKSNQVFNENIPQTETSLFNLSPIILDDGISYYSHACNNPSFQFLIPLALNDDSYIDFIAHFWCDSLTPAEFSDKPVPDALVAYVSNEFGVYNIDNLSIFGEISPKLGGASRKYVRGDINNDGKDDFAFAMNAEDGRASYDHETMLTNYAYPSVLISSESGYDIIKLGKLDWGHSVQIKENEILFGGHQSQAFKYETVGWLDISEKYQDLSFASFLVLDDYIINSVRRNDAQGLELIRDNTIISSVMIPESFKVNFEAWNNDGTGIYDELGVYYIRGDYYFHGMISEMCKKDNLIVATINASKLINGEIIENGFYTQSETMPVTIFSFYEVIDDQLIEKSIQIEGEDINHNFNFFDCYDVNADNKKDLVAQVFSQSWNNYSDNNKGVPEVYIGADNSYNNLDTSNWPTYSLNEDSQGYLYDINSTGTMDLIIFPLKANSTSQVEIYLSNRNITDF